MNRNINGIKAVISNYCQMVLTYVQEGVLSTSRTNVGTDPDYIQLPADVSILISASDRVGF